MVDGAVLINPERDSDELACFKAQLKMAGRSFGLKKNYGLTVTCRLSLGGPAVGRRRPKHRFSFRKAITTTLLSLPVTYNAKPRRHRGKENGR